MTQTLTDFITRMTLYMMLYIQPENYQCSTSNTTAFRKLQLQQQPFYGPWILSGTCLLYTSDAADE